MIENGVNPEALAVSFYIFIFFTKRSISISSPPV